MDGLIFSVNSVAPVFLLVLVGIGLRYGGLIDETAVTRISSIVFTVAIPALTFTEISKTRFNEVFDGAIVLLSVGGTLLFYCLAWAASYAIVKDPRGRGPFIQGTMRGNNVIISLAIILNLYGEAALSKGAVVMAFLMPLYNVLSVVALTLPLHRRGSVSIRVLLKKIVTNPIIISILLALPFSYFEIRMPKVVDRSLGYLSQMTLPLALLNVGASLKISSLWNSFPAVVSSLTKVVVFPLSVTALAVALGIRGEPLGILFLIIAAPTAVASFVMARAMDNDSEMAAAIIAITTLLSIITIGAGLYVLRSTGLI